MRKKVLVILLSLCMTVVMLPTIVLAASTGSAIQLGAGGIAAGEHVYYGTNNVYYRVLSTTGNDGTYVNDKGVSILNPMLLISEYVFDSGDVKVEEPTNQWQGSSAQRWCSHFASITNFSAAELAAIAKTTKSDELFLLYEPRFMTFFPSSNILNGDKVFFLSVEEATNYFNSPSARIAKLEGNTSLWFLRSAWEDEKTPLGMKFVTFVYSNGFVHPQDLRGGWSVPARPAFNLNLNAVLFSSAAAGGKLSGAVGAAALNSVSTPATPIDWKLTILDSDRSFAVTNNFEQTVVQGANTSVSYTGATVGANEYVSAMIVDGSNTILYYGRIADKSTGDANGTADITLPANLAVGNYTLKVFTEQYNGDKKTDYASAFKDVSLTVTAAPVAVTGITNVPTTGSVGTEIDLTGATVAPTEATNKSIVWTVNSAGTTGVTTSNLATGKFTPAADGTLELTATITNGATLSTDYIQTFDIIVVALPTTTHALNVNLNGGNGGMTNGNAEGAMIAINAGTKSGYSFNGWTSSDGGSFANSNNTSTSFTMPGNATNIAANWTYNGDSLSSGGSSSGGGATKITTTTANQQNQPITAADSITATVGTNGTASVSISDKAVTDAISKAQTELKKQGKTANGIAVGLNVAMPKGATTLTATLSQNALNSLVSAGVTTIEISGSPITLTFNQKALTEIQKQSSGDVDIAIAPQANLSEMAEAIIGTRPVYNITVGYGDNSTVSSFGSGVATVAIPYTPANGEDIGGLYAVYVDENGNATRVEGSAYDADSGCIIFTTTHFSMYGIGYSEPSDKLTDISSHWAKESIDYIVGRGLLSGISETSFTPNTAMTRGMLVTALGRLECVDVSSYTKSSFTDVKAGSAFKPYIEWAYEKGIIQGIGNNKFAPDRAITREEIAVIVANFTKATGYTLPVKSEATTYADDSSISSTYKTAVTAMQQAGIMMGGTGNKFNPKSNATRAEVSSMLYRYIQLTTTSETTAKE